MSRLAPMSRLALLLVGAAFLGGCDQQSTTPPPRPRVDGVAASKSAAKPKPSAAPIEVKSTKREPRTLCKGQSQRDAPEDIQLARAVDGATKPGTLGYGDGKWVWVNVWAAWCEPCKREMPMLRSWRDKLNGSGVAVNLAFVSIDDDARELDRFMKSQPSGGLKASYWLQAEDTRDKWFESLGYDDTPKLPIHALITPGGKLACVIEGAVEKEDFDGLSAYLKAGS
jgi:thiol-disulfide isomerase/thioredoxin